MERSDVLMRFDVEGAADRLVDRLDYHFRRFRRRFMAVFVMGWIVMIAVNITVLSLK